MDNILKFCFHSFTNGTLHGKKEFNAVYVSTPPGNADHEESTVTLTNNEQVTKENNIDWNIVGQLRVRLIEANGLNSKRNVYCILQLDDVKLQTSTAISKFWFDKVWWDKDYVMPVYDITSTLEVKVFGSAMLSDGILGQLSIPLLRIKNGETRWYGLKDTYKRSYARGNYPRIQLEMYLIWNPPKASLKLFRPKTKQSTKAGISNISLLYRNIEFVRDTLLVLQAINEHFKRLFEWNDQELSLLALVGWLVFWYYFRLWAAPLLLLIPFMYFWLFDRTQQEISVMRRYCSVDESDETQEKTETGKGLIFFTLGLFEMVTVITEGIEYIASIAERVYNLASFKVPYLSYFTMILLVVLSVVLYCIPFNFLMMSLGVCKFTRKYMYPRRVLNNDILDFISRVPDNEVLKDWKELKVPEDDEEIRSENLSKKVP